MFFVSIAATGFAVAFAHAAIPTHWLPFVLAGRGQRGGKLKTLLVVALCGAGHVLFTTLLGVLVVWLGIETSKWTGNVFPWIAGGALILFGLYYLVRQARGGQGHHHFGAGHDHHGHDRGHGHGRHGHSHGGHNHASETKRIDTAHGVLVLEIFEEGIPPRFRVRTGDAETPPPRATALSLETLRADGARQFFSFAAREGYLESVEKISEPHEFSVNLSISHGDHAHCYEVRFEEHRDAAPLRQKPVTEVDHRSAGKVTSDRAASDSWSVTKAASSAP